MNWTIYIAPHDRPSELRKYEVTADKVYYAQIKALISYSRDIGTDKRPRQLMKEVDIQVKCHTDRRLVNYAEVLQ